MVMCEERNEKKQVDVESSTQENSEQSDVEVVRAKEREIEAQLQKCREQNLYLQADFDNFRRNIAKERGEWTATTKANLVRDLLPVVDNFERALADLDSAKDIEQSVVARLQGINLIYKEMQNCLASWSVTVINADVFDPSLHEAVAKLPATEACPAGAIVDVLQKGYQCGTTIIRPARVVVAQ